MTVSSFYNPLSAKRQFCYLAMTSYAYIDAVKKLKFERNDYRPVYLSSECLYFASFRNSYRIIFYFG